MDSSSTPTVEPVATCDQSTQLRKKAKTDKAWDYCTEITTDKRSSIKCMFCNEVFHGGGIHRFKKHLACIKGDVKQCTKVDAEVSDQMKQSLEGNSIKKRKAQEESEVVVLDEEEQPREGDRTRKTRASKATAPAAFGKFFMSRTNPGDQPTIKSVLHGQEVKEKVDITVSQFFIDACISFNASNSKFYQPMFDAVASYGAGYKAPSLHDLRGYLLAKNVEEIKKFIAGYRKVWKETGCSIMADGWTDRKKRTLINFLVYCPKGTVFLKSVDATDSSKTGDYLFKLFRDVVNYVGSENVVQFVTDNAANMVAAGKKLEQEFPSLYWSPCAAHCLNLMLSDFGKEDLVKRTVSHATAITKYVYNHCYPLYLLRQFTKGRDILRPAPTRFATNFVALQSILKQKANLCAMVTSREWTSCAYAKEAKGKEFARNVLNQDFWKDCATVCNLSEPIVRVLRIVDSDEKPAMGYLFGALHASVQEIEKRFQRKKTTAQPFLKIIEERWDKHLEKNIHAAGFWFNPNNQYDEKLMEKYYSTTSGVLDCIEKFAKNDGNLRSAMTREMRIFRNAEGDFGRLTAKNDRHLMLADEWWRTYGCSAPNLQKLAIRILSQTCSASGCERNWSLFEHIHSKKRNRLEHQRLNDLVFVHYNLRLMQRFNFYPRNYDPINLEDIVKGNEDWVTEDSPARLTSEELETYRSKLAELQIVNNDDDVNEVFNVDDADVDDEVIEEMARNDFLNGCEDGDHPHDDTNGDHDAANEPTFEDEDHPWGGFDII